MSEHMAKECVIGSGYFTQWANTPASEQYIASFLAVLASPLALMQHEYEAISARGQTRLREHVDYGGSLGSEVEQVLD
jgi:hypothetical protein